MSFSPRRALVGIVALACLVLLLLEIGARPTGHERGLVARARRITLGEPDPKVRSLLGLPGEVHVDDRGTRFETYEAAGEQVVVGLDSTGVTSVRGVPDIRDPWSGFEMLAPRGIYPQSGRGFR